LAQLHPYLLADEGDAQMFEDEEILTEFLGDMFHCLVLGRRATFADEFLNVDTGGWARIKDLTQLLAAKYEGIAVDHVVKAVIDQYSQTFQLGVLVGRDSRSAAVYYIRGTRGHMDSPYLRPERFAISWAANPSGILPLVQQLSYGCQRHELTRILRRGIVAGEGLLNDECGFTSLSSLDPIRARDENQPLVVQQQFPEGTDTYVAISTSAIMASGDQMERVYLLNNGRI
jgi:hypothetical protein